MQGRSRAKPSLFSLPDLHSSGLRVITDFTILFIVCRYKNVFNIETKERVYFLVAKSQSDMESWVDALCKVCGLHTDNS